VKLTTHLHLMQGSRMRGAIPSLPKYLMAWCIVKHGDNFTFTFALLLSGIEKFCSGGLNATTWRRNQNLRSAFGIAYNVSWNSTPHGASSFKLLLCNQATMRNKFYTTVSLHKGKDRTFTSLGQARQGNRQWLAS
jgi:hypothetical protein